MAPPPPPDPLPSGILFYAIGIPAFAMFLLWRNKNSLDSASFRERYAFLYDGYDVTPGKGRYLWEAVVLLRKIGIAVVSVAITEPFLQIYAAVVLVTLFLCLQVRSRVLRCCFCPPSVTPTHSDPHSTPRWCHTASRTAHETHTPWAPLNQPSGCMIAHCARFVHSNALQPLPPHGSLPPFPRYNTHTNNKQTQRQVAVRPFSTREMNGLETGSLVTLWITLMASVLFWRVSDVQGGGADATTSVVLLVNFAMLAVFVAAIVRCATVPQCHSAAPCATCGRPWRAHPVSASITEELCESGITLHSTQQWASMTRTEA